MAGKEKIYTIPVNDAFNQEDLCPVCVLEEERTADLLEYYLGPSLMEPDSRMETNEKGFCPEHLKALFNSQENRLGFGLMLHTHLLKFQPEFEEILTKAEPGKKNGFFDFSNDWKADIDKAVSALKTSQEKCALCESLNDTMYHYYDVIFYQYLKEAEFREKFKTIKPFCIKHLAKLLEMSKDFLKRDEAAEFINLLADIETTELENLSSEVEYFTKKFDYKNKEKPWKNSKTAIRRTIYFLASYQDLMGDN